MTTSKLFERINTCALAMRRVPGDGDESHESSYNRVMRSMPQKMKIPKNEKTKLTKACMEYIRGAFAERDTPDRKLKIAMCVVVSIASGLADKDGLTKAICDRFRGLDDYDHRAMSDVFNLSILNDRALALLNKVMILKKKNVRRDIQHEFRVEFVLIFFGMLESALRRGEALDDLGYVIHAIPSDMKKARETLEKHVSLIATRCGPCFNLEAVKEARPRTNLFPVNGTLPLATIGCEHADFDQATINTLKNCFVDDTKEKDEFLDIIFAIISHAHRQPLETFAGIKTETVAIFFMKTILEETEADDVMNAIKETMRIKGARDDGKERGGDVATKELCEDLNKQLAKAKEETMRIKGGKERGGDEVASLRKKHAAANEKKDLATANAKCKDQREHALRLRKQCFDLRNQVAREAAEVETWKSISKTSKEGHLRKEIAALRNKWDESERDAENLRRVDAERKKHLDRVIVLNESLEKKAADKERQAKQAS
ncbi:unnamed protein product, partial [Ectocarpus fasciculatus]